MNRRKLQGISYGLSRCGHKPRWRSGWDSNPREIALKLISNLYGCLQSTAYSVYASSCFVRSEKPHET